MIRKNFLLGDEWLYVKFYGGPVFLENFLVNQIAPFIRQLKKDGLINKWFFIRYYESGYHLRARLHLKDTTFLSRVLNLLNQLVRPHLEKKFIWKIQADTYQREIERYGVTTMDLAEKHFHSDSEMITELLKNLKQLDNGEDLRWLYGIYFVNYYLNLFQFDLELRVKFLEHLRDSYLTKFSDEKLIKKQLSKKFRKYRPTIESFLKDPSKLDPNKNNHEALLKYIADTKKTLEGLNAIKNVGKIKVDLNSLNASFIHMTMNRLFRTKANINEMVCYDLLAQLIKSEIARIRSLKKRGK